MNKFQNNYTEWENKDEKTTQSAINLYAIIEDTNWLW